MKRPTKYFASIPYVERQARFAKLGPAYIVRPVRFIENSLRYTLLSHAGPADTEDKQRLLARAMKAGMLRINQVRESMGLTWQSIALMHHKGEGFVAR